MRDAGLVYFAAVVQ